MDRDLIAFCASLVAAIFALNTFIPDYVDKNHAREAFFVGDYEEVPSITAHANLFKTLYWENYITFRYRNYYCVCY